MVTSSRGSWWISSGPTKYLFFGSTPGIQSVILTLTWCFPVIIEALVGEQTGLAEYAELNTVLLSLNLSMLGVS